MEGDNSYRILYDTYIRITDKRETFHTTYIYGGILNVYDYNK